MIKEHGKIEPSEIYKFFHRPFDKAWSNHNKALKYLNIGLILFLCSLFLLCIMGVKSISNPCDSMNLNKVNSPQSSGTNTLWLPKVIRHSSQKYFLQIMFAFSSLYFFSEVIISYSNEAGRDPRCATQGSTGCYPYTSFSDNSSNSSISFSVVFPSGQEHPHPIPIIFLTTGSSPAISSIITKPQNAASFLYDSALHGTSPSGNAISAAGHKEGEQQYPQRLHDCVYFDLTRIKTSPTGRNFSIAKDHQNCYFRRRSKKRLRYIVGRSLVSDFRVL